MLSRKVIDRIRKPEELRSNPLVFQSREVLFRGDKIRQTGEARQEDFQFVRAGGIGVNK